jgi:outer membrane murein-binding lipoprotein Lpp
MKLVTRSAVILAIAALSGCVSTAQQDTIASTQVCDISHFGAVANDTQFDDAAIQAAIGAYAGKGGQVRLPAGVFLTGGVVLQSQMELHLSAGAILRGAPQLAQYTAQPTGDEGRFRGVVTGIDVRDVSITGSGVIDGAGTPFHATPNARPDYSLGLFGCSSVRIRDVRIIDPAKYHVTLNRCSDVVVDGVTILADMLAPNSDGIQVRDSSDVRISNCRIETGDDAIVLKSSARVVERISISNCTLVSDDAALKFGTGSEPGMRHVNVSGVTITNSRYGIALFMQDGGIYEHNRFADMVISTGGRHAREYPIFVDIDTRQPDDPGGWGRISGLTFDGIDIRGRGNILIQGQPGHDVEGLTLSNITMHVQNAVDVTQVNGKPRGNRAHAPRTGAADYSNVNAHVVIGHARGVTLSNVVTSGSTSQDQRPAVRLIDVHDVSGVATNLTTARQ